MTTFAILRWDALIETGSMAPKPMVYIRDAVPQTNSVLAIVTGTGTEYDGKQLIAGIRKPAQSGIMVTTETGQAVSLSDCSTVVLYASWLGYPPRMGSVTLFEVTEPPRKVGGGDACDSSIDFGDVSEKNAVAESVATPPPTLEKRDTCNSDSTPLSVSQIVGVWIVLIAIYAIIRSSSS